MTTTEDRRIVFTPERLTVLERDWAGGVCAHEIAKRLNKLPGLPVRDANAVRHKASALGLQRPEGWLLARKKTAKRSVWSVDRLELLRNLINLIPDADVLEKVNALPGTTVKNIGAMRDRAQRMGYLAERPRKPGTDQTTWTEERLALLRQCYGRLPPAELVAALNAMPGLRVASIKTVRSAAARMGIKSAGMLRTPPPPRPRRTKPRPMMVAPEPAPRPLTQEEQEANVARHLAHVEQESMKMYAKGKDPHAVSGALKIHLREAFRLYGLHRQQKQEAA
jgi:hypothetical protein